MEPTTLTRRKLLAGLGVTGAASIAGLGVLTEPSPRYTETSTIQQFDSVKLAADWRETYNGTVLEDTTMARAETGATLSLQNVMPGDNGVLSVRLRVVSETPDASQSVDPRLTLTLDSAAENGRTEPERVAGDATADRGELQEFIDAALWFDTGLAAVDAFGADNAVRDIGEQLVVDGAEGTLAEVASSVNDVSLARGDCLGVDGSVTVSLGWSFEKGAAGSNAAQGDSLSFEYSINARQCGGE